ncbi:HAD domain-containing protein [Gottfriedia acidiceleris]|uniref:HAD domain-containing protein n=1 Tax=Bacillaceae TaxID=186817 RepID=UPI000BECC01E|nr:HAD domain-containing protein [Bacillus sp. AFS096315]PEC48145.1 hypothetical protein CON00_17640 [Bacillus sp. AFS096315]
MKIIFLDIDGVLNTDRQIRMNNLEQIENIKFDPIAMKNLKKIVDETNAKIVIISTWRVHRQDNGYLWRELIRNFKLNNLDTNILLDVTPVIDKKMKPEFREKEILEWLTKHKNIEKFVILDDQWDMGGLNNFFVRCLSFRGITSEIAEEAILKLK